MNSKKEVQHVYLVGAKSLGAYGGYETFVYKLTEYHQNNEKYIHECYDGKGINGRNPKTTFIAYGADLTLSKLADDGYNVNDVEIVEKIASIVGKEKLFVKTHPRNPENRFEKLGYSGS